MIGGQKFAKVRELDQDFPLKQGRNFHVELPPTHLVKRGKIHLSLSLSLRRGETRKTEKIDSDRKKRKEVSSIDRDRGEEREKHHRHNHLQQKKKGKSSAMASKQQVRASHILIKHQGSRRKASWKDPEGRVIMNTTKESAIAQLKSLREDLLSGKAKFDEVASRYSDCSSAKRGGDLGLLPLSRSVW